MVDCVGIASVVKVYTSERHRTLPTVTSLGLAYVGNIGILGA